jgi:hypothetical protein
MQEAKEIIKQIIHKGTPAEKKTLFGFTSQDSNEKVLKKFQLFSKSNYIRFFKGPDAPFHREMILNMIRAYRGERYINLAFRGSSKTSLLKLFLTFAILNDKDRTHRYIKVLSRDIKNAKQIVTDVYNMCLDVFAIYGDVFEREGEKKREERMDSFTMKSGVKLTAGSVGQTQRGMIQDAYRPSFIAFEDIEDRESISSQVMTDGVIAQCDEAIAGLDKNGSWMLTGNYISENGSIQWFLNKKGVISQITPIMRDGVPTWSIYTLPEIERLKHDSEDFFGEYMQDPARSEGKFFDIDRIDRDLKNCREPQHIINDVKYWNGYLMHHRYGIGADTSEGIGLDSNALANFDFTTGELIVTYHSNNIKPELFAYQIAKLGKEYGECVVAPEINNMSGGIVITTLKAIYENIFRATDRTKIKEIESAKLGWHTNSRSKPQMFMDFRRDYNDGIIHIYDSQVLKEMKSFSNNDITENAKAGSITRHFDLLTAVVIAWAMRNVLTQLKTAIVQNWEIDE